MSVPLRLVSLSDGYHLDDLRNFGLEYSLNSHLQGHLAHRTASARSHESDLYDAVLSDLNEFDVATGRTTADEP